MKKKALYTYLSVKELEIIKALIINQIQREKMTLGYYETLSNNWKKQSHYISELTSLFLKTEEVRIKTCYIDKEYKKEVGIDK